MNLGETILHVTLAVADQPDPVSQGFSWFSSVIVPGVVASLFSSLVFLIGLRVLTPRVKLSPQIALGKSQGSNESSVPRIKIINRGLRDIYDVKVECYFQWTKKHSGRRSSISDVKMTEPYFSTTPFATVQKRKLRDAEYDNCVRIRLKGKDNVTLKQAWDKVKNDIDHNAVFVVSVSARDSWSGVIRTFRQEYLSYEKSVIRGEFQVGDTFSIEVM